MMRLVLSCSPLILAASVLPLTAETTSYVLLAKNQGNGSTAFAASIPKAGGQVVANLEQIGVVLATSANPQFATLVKRLPSVQQVATDMKVQWISPNEQSIAANDVPPLGKLNSEPYGMYQWNLGQIGADRTAAEGYLGKDALVAVLDSGLLIEHPDIFDNVRVDLCKSFVPDEGVEPKLGGFNHGTHVAGIIAAPINGKGVQGVAPQAEIMAVKVLSEKDGSGDFGWLIQGIIYAVQKDADVINMSLGAVFPRWNAGGGGAGPLIAALNRAVNYATASGVFVVSAAGNDGLNLNSILWSIPAQSGNGVAVSATGPNGLTDFDRVASYSNYGQSVVNVAAPGGDAVNEPFVPYDMILSPGGTRASDGKPAYYWAIGTSMAAPHVSGLAALLISQYGHMPPSQLKALIEKSADDILWPGVDAGSGHGRINAAKALGLK